MSRKPCVRCGGEKPPGPGVRYCGACRQAMLPAWQQADNERHARPSVTSAEPQGRRLAKEAPTGTKWCPRCATYRRLADFPTSKGRPRSYCKPCESLYAFEGRLEAIYGITLGQYDALFAAQQGTCAICGATPRSQRLAVDHDHRSGLVRGLLCKRCNHKVLGGAGDNADILRRAAAYLDDPPAFAVIGQVGITPPDQNRAA